MNVLITGGAGFIGSHTADALIARGDRVRLLDNLQLPVHLKGRPTYLPNEAEFVFGGCEFELRIFEILFRDAALVVKNAATLVFGARVVHLRARVEQRLLIFRVGLRNRASEETALVGPRFVESGNGFGALGQ